LPKLDVSLEDSFKFKKKGEDQTESKICKEVSFIPEEP